MSTASKNSSHRRNDSGELVVFEAARYFSSTDENPGYHNSSAVFPHKMVKDGGAARMSLDMPGINSDDLPTIQKQYLMREKKKCKQPSSPGGRLASFLNSLFSQTNSKKKKKSKTSNDDEHDDHIQDRRRRSISHFRITTNCDSDSNSTLPASVTPSSYAKTPTKSSYKDFKNFSDGQKAVSRPKNGETIAAKNGSFRNPTFIKFGDVDDGDDSDSSSDLFDLPNLDLYSSGLPVYGSTNMDRIRIGAPISSSATV